MADNKDKKVLNVPALRFPEFIKSWECSILEKLSKKIGDGIHSTPSYDDNGTFYFINGNNLNGGKIVITSSTKRVSEKEAYKNNAENLEANSILMSINGTIGNVALYHNEPIMLGKSACYINSKDNIDKNYLFYYLQYPKTQLYFEAELTGTTIKNLSLQSIRKTKIYIPTIEEQHKISRFLQKIDERISTQNKIIEKYESLIQAIIYKEKMDGISKGTWQRIALCKVLQERNEKNVNGRTICSVSVSQGVVNQVEYLGRSFAAKQTSHYNIVKYGDIVYTKSPTGNFPYGIIKRSNIREDVAVSPLYGVYIPASDSIGVFLHFYFMQPSNAFNYLHPLIQKGAKNTINITNGRFLENSVLLPISKSEANTIAGILKTIQAKIEIEKNLLQSYTKEKEYLLRQMFI
ncbi:restriction endonuclease subunit S [Bacteroides ovatus]|nr:restriction endonuclease subunit S [Bacteroides ovatus]RGY58388.1 restriction endonuclease subunit S [Bacteroides ovatus]